MGFIHDIHHGKFMQSILVVYNTYVVVHANFTKLATCMGESNKTCALIEGLKTFVYS